MNGVLGGFKNMLRTWRNNLKKKKLKEEKINKEKITKFSRLQSFIYSTLAIIYWPIGTILFSKSKIEKAKEEQPKLYKEVKKINLKLDELIINKKQDSTKEVIKIEKQVKKIKQEIKKPMTTDSYNYFKEKTIELEKKVDYIKNPEKYKKEIIAIKEQIKKQEPVPELILQPINQISKEETKEKKNNSEFIKKANKDVKEIEEKLKKIKSKIGSVTIYNELYDLENKLKELNKKLELLKEQYKELKIEKDEIYPFDKIELFKSPKKIDELIEEVDLSLKMVESKKDELFYKKEEKKEEKKAPVEEKVKQEKKEVEKKKEKIDESLIAQELIIQNIMNQEKLLEEYMKKLNSSKNKKKTLFSSLLSFSRNVINFSISLIPITLLRNKLLGTFISTVMINNSIKTMRKMANPKLQINYEAFDKTYFESKNLIESSYYMCENSLKELDELKDELILLGANKEAATLLQQLDNLENNIKKQQDNLNYRKNKLNKVYTKIKKIN